jgi:hypothetical protein
MSGVQFHALLICLERREGLNDACVGGAQLWDKTTLVLTRVLDGLS